MEQISAAEQKRRQDIVNSVYGTHAMEGMFPDETTQAIFKKWIAGELSEEERAAAMYTHAHALAALIQETVLAGAA